MKAAVYKAQNRPLVLEEIPKPVPATGQVLIEVKACGICGSDIHASQVAATPTNIVMGHEYTGVIAQLGPGVSGVSVGERVVSLAQLSCGLCEFCQAGEPTACKQVEYVDFNPRYNGAYSE